MSFLENSVMNLRSEVKIVYTVYEYIQSYFKSKAYALITLFIEINIPVKTKYQNIIEKNKF